MAIILRINIMSIVKLGVTKPIDTIWSNYHFKIMNMTSLSGKHKMEFYQPKSFMENPGGKVRPCLREDCDDSHF